MASAAWRRMRLPSAAAATCRVSEAAQAASAAAAGSVPASSRIRAAASSAARAACSQIAFRSAAVNGSPGAAPGAAHRWQSLGQVRSGASLPPLYHTGPPSLAVSPGSATAYPVTWPGFFALNRWRASTPARSRRAKNSCSLRAPAAAVVTWRRSMMRGGSSRPRRAALAVSAREGRQGRGPVGGRGGLQPVAFLGSQARRPHAAGDLGGARRGLRRRGRRPWRSYGTGAWRRSCSSAATGCPGLGEEITATWPETTVQTCTVHLIRRALGYASYNDPRRWPRR